MSTSILLLIVTGIFVGCRGGDAKPPSVPGEPDASTVAAASVTPEAPHVQAPSPVEAGRYLVTIGGCNDCHTSGYLEADGNLPESEWLAGSVVGFRGPWGTSYPSNLRLTVQDYDEDVFVQMVRMRKSLPPMPWPNMNRMSEQDVRSIYRFIASLGPTGERMPTAVAPGQEPTTPYIDFVPQHIERLSAAAPTGDATPTSP